MRVSSESMISTGETARAATRRLSSVSERKQRSRVTRSVASLPSRRLANIYLGDRAVEHKNERGPRMSAVTSPAVRTDDRLEFVEYRQRTSEFIPLYEPVVTEEMRQAVLRGYDERLWIRGSRTWESQGKKFEEEVCRFIGCDYAVNMTSGTAALLLALKAFGIGAGDEVITVPNTFPAPTDVIMWAGATPVYVDMDLETYCIDVSQ